MNPTYDSDPADVLVAAIEASDTIMADLVRRGAMKGASDQEWLGTMAITAGFAVRIPRPSRSYNDLGALAAGMGMWACRLDDGMEPAAFWERVREEYRRAYAKHGGMTPYNPEMSDDHRAAILIEEVGEVARACTPDASSPTGHGGDLMDEIVQVATMAVVWLARAVIDSPEEGWTWAGPR